MLKKAVGEQSVPANPIRRFLQRKAVVLSFAGKTSKCNAYARMHRYICTVRIS
jgi:hypothetical protein